MSIDNRTKQRVLEKILESYDFRKAQKYQDLLRFLVSTSIKGEDIKESTLAHEVFGKEAAFDPSVDSTVRAYVSNVRKKLEHYYLTEGQNDEIQMVLPKGEYKIEFVQIEKEKAVPPTRIRRFPYLVFIALVAILLAAVIFLGVDKLSSNGKRGQFITKNDLIWGEIFNSTKRTLIVLGDYYFFAMPLDSGRHSYIRDVKINSDNDLEEFIDQNLTYKGRIAKTYHTYLDEHLPWSLSYILPSFVYHNKDRELKLASELQLEDLQRYDIIYIGPYKCLNVLKPVVRNLNFKYTLGYDSKLAFFDQGSKKQFTYSWVSNPETQARNDYAIVVKVPGGNNNTLMFFLSENDFGNISTVKHFSNPAYLQEMRSKITSSYFEALFEVKGIVRTDFEIKLLHVNPLSSNFEISIK
ncbi:MAG TPA: hypothetical protein VGA99_12585 [bacterium]